MSQAVSSPDTGRAAIDQPGFVHQWTRSFSLAVRDALHEWPVSLCFMLALAAVLTPLLVLFGLKSGIVTTMTERLKADPHNLEITVRGNHHLKPSWVSELADKPEVGFVVPRTRTLAATIDLIGPDHKSVSGIDMIATAAGDPLLPPERDVPRGVDDVTLSHTVATKLGVGRGDRVDGVVRRRLEHRDQRIVVSLQVQDVLPEAAFRRDGAFVSVPLLVATEDYRDGYGVSELGVLEGKEQRQELRRYAGIRLYARSLDGVAGLAAALREEGFDVITRANEIETVKAIDRTLSFIFIVIAVVGVTGFLLSLAASIWANVDRKRRELALLRLLGLKTGALIIFPASQALIVAVGGLVLSASLYLVVSALFNTALASNLGREEFVCRLFVGDGIGAALLTLASALGASAVGAYRAAKSDPAEHLREL